jgi:glucose-1-phosphate thymidylyltransferase
MKGIILAGGSGSRLYPLTLGISKHLLPIYDKPMIYYPLSVLVLAGLKEILIISTPRDVPLIQGLLGDGRQFGIRIEYKVQPSPDGLAQAFILGEEFLAGDSACLILGDNIFYGTGLLDILENAKNKIDAGGGSCVFGYFVKDPERYGVVEFDAHGKALSLVEKPKEPKSRYAVTGLYFYDNTVCARAKALAPSARGELEITDLNKTYLAEERLDVQLLGRGFAWLDAGTHDSLLDASQYVAAIEKRQGLKVGCLEEAAWRKGFITNAELNVQAQKYKKTTYGEYLFELLEEDAVECV